MIRGITLLALIAFGGLIVRAQTPGVVGRSHLIRESSTIVIGTVEDQALLVRSDLNRIRTETLPDGQKTAILPDMAKALAGRVLRLRLSEVIKGEGVEIGDTINVYLEHAPILDGGADLRKGFTYMVFLSRLKADEEKFKNTVIRAPGKTTEASLPFNPRSHYTVVGEDKGVVPASPQNQTLMEEIRSEARGSR
jgi:hypothetical protein